MKELSKEEKAKRYDEVLEELRGLLECVREEKREILEEDIISIFSELQENEDERIRKGIIRNLQYLMDMSEGFVKEDLQERIAWLEKQGEQKPQGKTALEAINEEKVNNANKVEPKDYSSIDPHFGKPIDKVEPKFKVKYAGNEYNVLEVKDIAGVTFYGIEDEPNHIDYVKAENCERVDGYNIKENGSTYPTKPAVFSEQKPAWSKDDEEMLDEIIDFFENGTVKLQHDLSLYASWLKSLKDRVKIQQEWTMQDEEELQIALDTLVKAGQHSSAKWLKNVCLVPQNKWKPSGVQMTVLDDVITNGHLANANERILKGLQEQLRKLK